MLLLLLLLCHTSPELHAISRHGTTVSNRRKRKVNNKANARIEHFHCKWIRVHKRVERRWLAWPAKCRQADAVDVVVVVERRVNVLLQGWLEGGTGDKVGIVTVCTGVMPPNGVLLPPQNPFAARRGDVVGKSLCVFGVSNGDVDAELRDVEAAGVIGSGLGGGRTGESACPALERSAFLSAFISCCRAAFSDRVEPSSVRIASMSRSRSATSPSRVVMYSVDEKSSEWPADVGERTVLTLTTVAEIARANLVT
jgi:hypothetical protein